VDYTYTAKIEHHPFICNSLSSKDYLFPSLSVSPKQKDIARFDAFAGDTVKITIHLANKDKNLFELFDTVFFWRSDDTFGDYIQIRSEYDKKIIANGEQAKLKMTYTVTAKGDNDCSVSGVYEPERGVYQFCGDRNNGPTISLNFTYFEFDSTQDCPILENHAEL
jgi:hypothetical protein